MVPIIILEFFCGVVLVVKEDYRLFKNAFFGHRMNKLQIFKVLKIGVPKIDYRVDSRE